MIPNDGLGAHQRRGGSSWEPIKYPASIYSNHVRRIRAFGFAPSSTIFSTTLRLVPDIIIIVANERLGTNNLDRSPSGHRKCESSKFFRFKSILPRAFEMYYLLLSFIFIQIIVSYDYTAFSSFRFECKFKYRITLWNSNDKAK